MTAPLPSARLSVLLLDDDTFTLDLLADMLGEIGQVDVRRQSDARSALQVLGCAPPWPCCRGICTMRRHILENRLLFRLNPRLTPSRPLPHIDFAHSITTIVLQHTEAAPIPKQGRLIPQALLTPYL